MFVPAVLSMLSMLLPMLLPMLLAVVSPTPFLRVCCFQRHHAHCLVERVYAMSLQSRRRHYCLRRLTSGEHRCLRPGLCCVCVRDHVGCWSRLRRWRTRRPVSSVLATWTLQLHAEPACPACVRGPGLEEHAAHLLCAAAGMRWLGADLSRRKCDMCIHAGVVHGRAGWQSHVVRVHACFDTC